MSEEKIITETQATQNPILGMTATAGESELKDFLVNYTGTKLDEEEVTVQMIADVLAAEFPEFAFSFAEENYIRGYELGLEDAYRSIQKESEIETSSD
tara:strand:+ start:2140 stop:2433 length:294 start_codon:yes stop_codon:yes gene_type:complete